MRNAGSCRRSLKPVCAPGYSSSLRSGVQFRRTWSERVDTALERYGSVTDARAVMYLFNGEPGRYLFPDGGEDAGVQHFR